jgi:predicted kinase
MEVITGPVWMHYAHNASTNELILLARQLSRTAYAIMSDTAVHQCEYIIVNKLDPIFQA